MENREENAARCSCSQVKCISNNLLVQMQVRNWWNRSQIFFHPRQFPRFDPLFSQDNFDE